MDMLYKQIEDKVTVLNIGISITDVPCLIGYIKLSAQSSGQAIRLINYVNVHAYYLSFFNSTFRNILNESNVVFCDGFGVKLAARMLGVRLGSRMTPPDWIDELFATCAAQNISVYFLGDEEHVVKLFAGKVQTKFPSLQIKGFHHGFFHKHNAENEQVVAQINASGADLIITGMGMPIQEQWAFQNQQLLKGKVVLATGALFRWYAGVEKRGPKLITSNGFEWLWRLLVQPKKVWKRYIIELPYFFMVVTKNLLHKKLPGRKAPPA